MNVTILVGNGFDLNLNLKTKYTDFLSYYCGDSGADHVTIQNFKQDILQEVRRRTCIWTIYRKIFE